MIDPRLDDPSDDMPVDAPDDHRRFPVQFLRSRIRHEGIRKVIIYALDCANEADVAVTIVWLLSIDGILATVDRLDPSTPRHDVIIDANHDGRHDSAIVRAVRQAIWSHGNAGKSAALSIDAK